MTYRTGNHWGVTIVREFEAYTAEVLADCAFCCVGGTGCPLHPQAEAQLVAVVVNGDQALAERICTLLNGDGCTRVGMHNCAGTWSDHGHAGGRPGPPSMGADGDAPSRPLSAPVSDLQPPLVAQSGVADPNAAETAYPNPAYRFARCGQRSAHGPHVVDHGPDQPRNCRGTGPGCICNDPPPTVDKPKNGTASRPPGWACPRHGAVI